nr:uncharacterized protein LOC104100139 [Nicotiana tomentosiformis]
MWLQVQGRMLTTDRLKKWGMSVDDTCYFCHQKPETRDHLFVECEYGKCLWHRLMPWLQIQYPPIDSWEANHQWIVMKTKGRSQMARVLKLVYAVYIHALWIDKNSRILEKQTTALEVLARRVACMCNFRAKGYTRVLLKQTEMVYSV